MFPYQLVFLGGLLALSAVVFAILATASVFAERRNAHKQEPAAGGRSTFNKAA